MSPHARQREWWLFVIALEKPERKPEETRDPPGRRRPILTQPITAELPS